jgi:hypothetical protein
LKRQRAVKRLKIFGKVFQTLRRPRASNTSVAAGQRAKRAVGGLLNRASSVGWASRFGKERDALKICGLNIFAPKSNFIPESFEGGHVFEVISATPLARDGRDSPLLAIAASRPKPCGFTLCLEAERPLAACLATHRAFRILYSLLQRFFFEGFKN